jgi:hypothetical protein
MLTLLLSLASPAAQAAECAAGEQFSQVLARLDLSVSEVLTVRDGCLAEDPGVVVDALDLRIECEIADCSLPPLRVWSSSLTVEGGRITRAEAIVPSVAHDGLAGTFRGPAGIYAEDSDIELVDVAIVALSGLGTGLITVDSNVLVTGGEFSDLSVPAISAFVQSADVTVEVDGTLFDDVGVVGIEADNSASKGSRSVQLLRVANATFLNQSTLGGDIYGSADVFEHENTTHYGSRAKSGGIVQVQADTTSVVNATFFDTATTGGSAGSGTLWVAGGSHLSIKGGTFQPANEGEYALKVFDVLTTEIVGGLWEPQRRMIILGGDISITGVRFRLPEHDADVTLVQTESASLFFDSNSACAVGRLPGVAEGLLVLRESAAVISRNVFQSILLSEGSLVFAGTEADGASQLAMLDNTLVDVRTKTILAGPVDDVTFVNNLVYGGFPRVDLVSKPDRVVLGYNLWYSPTFDPDLPEGWGDTDLFDLEPEFVEGYASGCPEAPGQGEQAPVGPAPTGDSIVVDAGSDELPDSPDGTRSDIGAIDFDHGSDTGDTGAVDTGDTAGDTGAIDKTDCSSVDDPATTADENCDGENAQVQYGGGCAFGGGALALAPLVALWRRRRPGAAMRG